MTEWLNWNNHFFPLLQLKYLSMRAHIHTHKLIYSEVFHGISQVHKSIVCWIYFMRNSNVHIFTETPFCFDSFKYFRIKWFSERLILSLSKMHHYGQSCACWVLSLFSCVQLFNPMDSNRLGSCPWDSPGKNTSGFLHFTKCVLNYLVAQAKTLGTVLDSSLFSLFSIFGWNITTM